MPIADRIKPAPLLEESYKMLDAKNKQKHQKIPLTFEMKKTADILFFMVKNPYTHKIEVDDAIAYLERATNRKFQTTSDEVYQLVKSQV